MPQSLESQVDTLGKLMDTIRKEFAALDKKVDGRDKQACDMIINLQNRATALEKVCPALDKKIEGRDKQACDMIVNLQNRVTALEKK